MNRISQMNESISNFKQIPLLSPLDRADPIPNCQLGQRRPDPRAKGVEKKNRFATLQEGDRQHPRHLYANPLNPVICPVLALAMITFTQPFRAEQEGMHSFRLFDGEHSAARFSSLLRSALVALSGDDLTAMGCPINDIGTHSTRKGAASYCAGFINGPSTLQIFLRAGWSIGNVPNRYIFAASGRDQLAGRVLAGLPFDDVSFSSLPPHFHGRLENFDLSFVCPLYLNYLSQFKVVVPYLC